MDLSFGKLHDGDIVTNLQMGTITIRGMHQEVENMTKHPIFQVTTFFPPRPREKEREGKKNIRNGPSPPP